MNYKMIGSFLSKILALEAVFMIPALLLCLVDGEYSIVMDFLCSIGVTAAFSFIFWITCHKYRKEFFIRESMICVGSGWIVMSLMGCLPFYLSGQIPHFIDALFEIVSGFTTTGASILNDVESLSRGILYWRSFSHWLGGMGVLVLLLAFAGKHERGGFTLHILRAESTGANVGKLVPRMSQTAVVLYAIYTILTVINYIFLLAGGMDWFEALCTAIGTAGTGGFAIKNDSMASYSPYIQNVCTVFMIIFGVNFGVYFLIIRKQIKDALLDEEVRYYFLLIIISIIAITVNLRGYYGSLEETTRHAGFQVASIISSTGFATTDYDKWPVFSKAIILLLMTVGACGGSTGGGLKVQRALILIKTHVRNLKKNLYPNKVQMVTLNKVPISERVISATGGYLITYVLIIIASFLIVCLNGFDIETNFTAVLSCFNNIGPGLKGTGPTCNYSQYSVLSKTVLIIDMLFGRLEIMPILAILSPGTWRRR